MLDIRTPDPLGVLETTRDVVTQAQHAAIAETLPEAALSFIRDVLGKSVPDPERSFQTIGSPEDDAQLVFIQDACNFCFWTERGAPQWQIERQDSSIISGGWYAFVECIARARRRGIPILDARYLETLSEQEAREIFAGIDGVMIPLFEKRVENLRETGAVLLGGYEGRASTLIDAAGRSAPALARRIIESFPSFNDCTAYKGREVRFFKRAQIAASDLGIATGIRLAGRSELTAFADYRLPQILRELGIITYDRMLAEAIDSQACIASGSEEEVEIRAVTIWAIERIRQALGLSDASAIDYALWLATQDTARKLRPHHRAYSSFY